MIKSEFNLNSNILIDTAASNWKSKWDELDIPKAIQQCYKSKGWDIKESKIKSKICTNCTANMTKKMLEEIDAYKEIEEWFSYIHELSKK